MCCQLMPCMLHASADLSKESLEYVLAAGEVTRHVDACKRACSHIGMAAGNGDAVEAGTVALLHVVKQEIIAAIADKERCVHGLTTTQGHNEHATCMVQPAGHCQEVKQHERAQRKPRLYDALFVLGVQETASGLLHKSKVRSLGCCHPQAALRGEGQTATAPHLHCHMPAGI